MGELRLRMKCGVSCLLIYKFILSISDYLIGFCVYFVGFQEFLVEQRIYHK